MQINSLAGKSLLVGDFNLHMDVTHLPTVIKFNHIIHSAGFEQFVHGPTHKHGHTLDLVLARPDDHLINSCTVGVRISDHNVVGCTLFERKPTANKVEVKWRNFQKIDSVKFQSDLKCQFDKIMNISDVDALAHAFEKSVINILDKHAPLLKRSQNIRSKQPWYNSDIHDARRIRRKFEKKWRKTGLEVYHEQYLNENKKVNELIENAKKIYISEKLQTANNSKTVYRVVNELLNNSNKVLPAHENAENMSNKFAKYFQEKVAKIYSGLKQDQPIAVMSNMYSKTVTCNLSEFNPVSEEDVGKLINGAATKSCVLDCLPTWLLKNNYPVFVPIISRIINNSLKTGIFPSTFKNAVLNPLIKKQSLNPEELKNYRPVANIKFLSKLIEKQVVNNIKDHMTLYDLGDDYQSAYCSGRSTETALLKVRDDMLKMIYNQKGVFLVMLDLSAAFDTVNHSVLCNRLENEIGVTGTALNWFKSYFSGRSTRVLINGKYSESKNMEYGLPQGSIVGPKSFTIYTIPISRIIKKYKLLYHIYADDIQIYISFVPLDLASIQLALTTLENCIGEIRSWMNENMLKLNNEKTEFFVASSSHYKRTMPNVTLRIGDDVISPSKDIRNLGIMFDDVMSMSTQVTLLSRSLTYHLRNISRIRRFMDLDTCSNILRSLVLSRLDYGNALLLGANTSHIKRLQRFQNWAAKIIFYASKRDHATPYLQRLHWLPVKERIQFKILLYVFKCLNGSAPSYLSSCFTLYNPTRTGLRSASDITLLSVPRYQSNTLKSAGDKSFTLASPDLWNKLPISLRTSISVSVFKKGLKTYLFPHDL